LTSIKNPIFNQINFFVFKECGDPFGGIKFPPSFVENVIYIVFGIKYTNQFETYAPYETAFNDGVRGETFVIPKCPKCGSQWTHYWKDSRASQYRKYYKTLVIQEGCVSECSNKHQYLNGVKYQINYD
jgi:hypothetical protein